jgi:hypothetical protein
MALEDLEDWIDGRLGSRAVWYLKRLSGNDTLANGSNQAGPYVPKDLLFEVLPQIKDTRRLNPDFALPVTIDSHGLIHSVRAVWYNNVLFGGTRNEARITGWGGISSPVLHPDSTGALAVFVFVPETAGRSTLRIWVCRNAPEEDLVESRIAPVEPGNPIVWRPGREDLRPLLEDTGTRAATCRLMHHELPPGWLTAFPTGADIVRHVCELRPQGAVGPDHRLLARRQCEFELFQSVEDAIESPRIARGFGSLPDFLTHAQRILQRRKARSGRSLELQARAIFLEEGLREGEHFAHQPESEPGRRPDFLFPSEAAYRDPAFPAAQLKLLAAKTTCRDRWRQILNEADRIPQKHLLTLQEGISESQFREMTEAGVRLVVPEGIVSTYAESIRPALITFGDFIGSVAPPTRLASPIPLSG